MLQVIQATALYNRMAAIIQIVQDNLNKTLVEVMPHNHVLPKVVLIKAECIQS